MILNKLIKWIRDDEPAWIVGFIIASAILMLILVFLTPPLLYVLFIGIVTILLAEWFYYVELHQKVMGPCKDSSDFILTKIIGLILSFPLVGILAGLVYFRHKIVSYIISPETLGGVLLLLGLLGILTLIYVYFKLNIKLGKYIVNKTKKKQKER